MMEFELKVLPIVVQFIKTTTGKFVLAGIILIATAILAHWASSLIRRMLGRNKANVPSSSIFINIVRVIIWALGICIMLSTCFAVDVSAAVAALGVGGIALSLGLRDTLSNLIAGLQVSLMGLIEPGDFISVGTSAGIVQDVNWRQTTVCTIDGRTIVIPNSIIGTTALLKEKNSGVVRIPITLSTADRNVDKAVEELTECVNSAARKCGTLMTPSSIYITDVSDSSVSGELSFEMGSFEGAKRARKRVINAMSDYLKSVSDNNKDSTE